MNETYVVTNGDYSEYRIMGTFDCPVLAEAFRAWYDFDAVEEHELNPETPPSPKGDQYQVWFDPKKDGFKLDRVSNEMTQREGWNRSCDRAQCIFFAQDPLHANKIGVDRVIALKTGNTFAYDTVYERKSE